MGALRLLLFVGLVLVLLVSGMLSATLLDFEPGAWVAFAALMFLAVGRLLGFVPFVGWIDGGD